MYDYAKSNRKESAEVEEHDGDMRNGTSVTSRCLYGLASLARKPTLFPFPIT